MPTPHTPTVYLVGAGPGDPGLITLRGVECLRRADVILYDYLVNPRILRHARADAEPICLGRHGHGRLWSQDEINSKMVEFALAGRVVVRLKGGDPAIFAHGAEEVDALRAAGLTFEVVPGITVALAASSFAGVPITHRNLASAVALVTGHEHPDKNETAIDFHGLARFPGTIVIYMGVTTVGAWTTALIEAGKDPATPAAIIRRCSWPDQRVTRCTLHDVADSMIGPPKMRPPIIVVVGPVAGLEEASNWFTQRPLFGQRILVTRPDEQADELANQLAELGADISLQPAIRIQPPASWQAVDESIGAIQRFDWVVFSSANGVRYWMDRLLMTGHDARHLRDVRLSAIGPRTAAELSRYYLKADLIPDADYRAESLADDLLKTMPAGRFLLVRASRGREALCETLAAGGAHVEQVVAYDSVDVAQADAEISTRLSSGGFDWITVTSSAIARSLHRLFGEHLRHAKLASISPITSATLRELGFEPSAEATTYTMPGLVTAICDAV